MQFNIYITIKNPENYTESTLYRAQLCASEIFGSGQVAVPDVDETVHLHEDAEVLITLNRSE